MPDESQTFLSSQAIPSNDQSFLEHETLESPIAPASDHTKDAEEQNKDNINLKPVRLLSLLSDSMEIEPEDYELESQETQNTTNNNLASSSNIRQSQNYNFTLDSQQIDPPSPDSRDASLDASMEIWKDQLLKKFKFKNSYLFIFKNKQIMNLIFIVFTKLLIW